MYVVVRRDWFETVILERIVRKLAANWPQIDVQLINSHAVHLTPMPT
jgi:hypothetical protein